MHILDFLTDNLSVLLGGRVFQQTIGIPKGTNCAPKLADLFLHVYDAFCLQGLLKNNNRKLVQTFISNFRCIDDVLSLNNSRFGDYLHRIYTNELNANDTQRHSYLDLHIEINNGGRLKPKLYVKRNDFTFPIVNFPFIRINIQASSAYGV